MSVNNLAFENSQSILVKSLFRYLLQFCCCHIFSLLDLLSVPDSTLFCTSCHFNIDVWLHFRLQWQNIHSFLLVPHENVLLLFTIWKLDCLLILSVDVSVQKYFYRPPNSLRKIKSWCTDLFEIVRMVCSRPVLDVTWQLSRSSETLTKFVFSKCFFKVLPQSPNCYTLTASFIANVGHKTVTELLKHPFLPLHACFSENKSLKKTCLISPTKVSLFNNESPLWKWDF